LSADRNSSSPSAQYAISLSVSSHKESDVELVHRVRRGDH
jgi:hypothetical protein